MKYYGHYNEDGEYRAFFNDSRHKKEEILKPYIELTEDQWQQALSYRCKVIDGKHVHLPLTTDEETQLKFLKLRNERDYLLKQSDWTQMPDSPLTEEKKQEWQTYRQALRDLPQTVDINNIEFPTKPQ